jgi:mRNA-degrading endonuclease RelE of RelBE toxin-antitoxin system
MDEYNIHEELKREQKKLNRMIKEALGKPIAENKDLLEQSQKVDRLMDLVKSENMRIKNKDYER